MFHYYLDNLENSMQWTVTSRIINHENIKSSPCQFFVVLQCVYWPITTLDAVNVTRKGESVHFCEGSFNNVSVRDDIVVIIQNWHYKHQVYVVL